MPRQHEPPTALLTFSCHGRNHWLAAPKVRDHLAGSFRAATDARLIDVHAWVIMSNHVHLLASDAKTSVASWLSSFRKDFSLTGREILRNELPIEARSGRFWLRGGGHRRAIWSWQMYWQKVHYLHANPVRAGLCATTVEWRWSSAIEYSARPRPDMPRISPPPTGLIDLLWWKEPIGPIGGG